MPPFKYSEQFTPLAEQYWNQITRVLEKIKIINKALGSYLLGDQDKKLKDQRQRLYKKKHTLKEKFLNSIFSKMEPQN